MPVYEAIINGINVYGVREIPPSIQLGFDFADHEFPNLIEEDEVLYTLCKAESIEDAIHRFRNKARSDYYTGGKEPGA